MDIKETIAVDSQRHPWEIARMFVLKKFIQVLLKRTAFNPDLILDIGCGDLYVAQQISSISPKTKIIGIDTALSENDTNSINQSIGSDITIFNSLDKVSIEYNTSVDLVLLLDVIEHIENDVDFFENLKKYTFITNETKFIITVPAYQTLFSSHDVFLEHYRRYNNKRLVKVLTHCGFSVIDSGYFFFTLTIPRLFKVLLEKIKTHNPDNEKGVGAWKSSSLKTAIIVSLLKTDFFICRLFHHLKIKIPGLSSYALCYLPKK